MLSGQLEGAGNFIFEIFSRVANQHSEHKFIYIFDRPFDPQLITSENIKPVIISPLARNPLLWKYWYDIKIPSTLKKIKADVFISDHGFCSLKTDILQCMIMHDISFLHQPSFIKKSYATYKKRNTPKFLNKANIIIAGSDFLKNELVEKYGVDDTKIATIHSGKREIFQPISLNEKEATKNKYTEDKEYFIYTGLMHSGKNLMTLLKAFSVFKKRQKTNMKLVLAGKIDSEYESFKKDLQSYKFRNDVVLVEELDTITLVNLIGAAYGFVNPSFIEEFPALVIEAMNMEVPVIAVETNTMKEITNDSILYVEEINHTAIADKMMLLYKDERIRNELIAKGKKCTQTYSWDTAAELLWQSVLKLMS